MRFRSGLAKLPIDNLHLDKPESVLIKFFVDGRLVLKAEKDDVVFEKSGESYKIANCRIRSINWDGVEHEGNCNWKISDVQN